MSELKEKELKDSIFISSYMINQLKIDGKFVVYEKNEKMMYFFNGKYYEPLESIDIDQMVRDLYVENDASAMWTTRRAKEIQAAMAIDNNCPRVKFDDYADYMCVNNGVIDLKTMTLLPHSKDLYFSYKIDVDYNPEAPEPVRFLKFINSCFQNKDGTIDNETINKILTIGGYILYPSNPLEKMFMFLGEGSNGKSVLLDVYKMFFSDKFTSYLSLESMCSEGFQREKLIGSKLNISSEAKSHEINAEELKKIISNEGITINPKYGKPINYVPRCKVLVASNAKPYFNDSSHGIMRRLYIVEFKNRFVAEEDLKDYHNAQKMGVFVADNKEELENSLYSERSGIFNLFLDALLTLKATSFQLKETENTKEIKEEYQASADSLGYWLKNTYNVDYGEFPDILTSVELLEKYREWYQQNVSMGVLKLSAISIGLKVKSMFMINSVRYSTPLGQKRGYPLKRKEVVEDDFNLSQVSEERIIENQSRIDFSSPVKANEDKPADAGANQ